MMLVYYNKNDDEKMKKITKATKKRGFFNFLLRGGIILGVPRFPSFQLNFYDTDETLATASYNIGDL